MRVTIVEMAARQIDGGGVMNSISLEMETPTASSFAAVRQNNPYTLYLTPTRPRPRFGRFRVLLVSACAIVATACASLKAAEHGDANHLDGPPLGL